MLSPCGLAKRVVPRPLSTLASMLFDDMLAPVIALERLRSAVELVVVPILCVRRERSQLGYVPGCGFCAVGCALSSVSAPQRKVLLGGMRLAESVQLEVDLQLAGKLTT
eukprot:1298410-Pleurochrysis_carterae.AAC.1